MKRIAILTTLIALATSTVAFAQVRTVDRDRDRDRDREVRVEVRTGDHGWTRDHYDRYDRSRYSREFRGRWVPLARAYSAQSERQFIELKGQAFRRLRIEGARGNPVIVKIGIEFGDGSVQAVDFNSRLSRGAGEVIDLNGGTRRIERIIVYTEPRRGGSYTIWGA